MKNNGVNNSQNTNVVLSEQKSIFSFSRFDNITLMLILMLITLGLVFIFSVTMNNTYDDPYFYINRQGLFAIVGIVAMLILSMIDYHMLLKISIPFYTLTIILLIIALWMPSKEGFHRFINISVFSIQPAPLSLIATIFLLVNLFSNQKFQNQSNSYVYFFLCLLVTIIPLSLILLEPFLSAASTLLCILLVFVFVKNPKFFYIMMGLSIVLMIVSILISDYSSERLRDWMDPFSSPNLAHQTIHSIYAIASGGVFGVGLGNGNAKNVLQDVNSNYILAGIIEEIGFVGAIFVILLFALLLWRIIIIAMRSKDKLGFYLGVGIFSYFAFRVLFHVFNIVNAIPQSSGFTLPFISYGGTSIMLDLMLMGILLNISRNNKKRNY